MSRCTLYFFTPFDADQIELGRCALFFALIRVMLRKAAND
jgi:hypothetical protein